MAIFTIEFFTCLSTVSVVAADPAKSLNLIYENEGRKVRFYGYNSTRVQITKEIMTRIKLPLRTNLELVKF